MSSLKQMEFEGKDVAEAISKACKTLNVSQENLDIEVLRTGTSGIFGLCRQKALLRVTVKGQEAEVAEAKPAKKSGKAKTEMAKAASKDKDTPFKEKKKAAAQKPAENAPEKEKENGEEIVISQELLAETRNHLVRILELMDLSSSVEVTSEREYVTALIQGEHVNEIVDQNGKILDSLQYLLRKIIGNKYSDKAIVSLDAGDFRATRSEELKRLGLELADEVKKSGKTRSIPSLNPSERRVVHLALQDDKEIRSRSVGEGLFKKVLIYKPGSKGRKGPSRKRKGRNKKIS